MGEDGTRERNTLIKGRKEVKPIVYQKVGATAGEIPNADKAWKVRERLGLLD